ncbi:MAG: hypothetical protein J7647_18010 [Cyanobacteria bacterium SBLK]|nr:hypothetical protein [Cyanobacteria bacterium SBLK]
MVEEKNESIPKVELTAPLLKWLDLVRGNASEMQFERDLGLSRNSIRNIREGKLPGAEKLVRIKRGTGISWEQLGALLEAPFLEESEKNSKCSHAELLSQSEIGEAGYTVRSYDLLVQIARNVESIKSRVLGEPLSMTTAKFELTKDTFPQMLAECVAEKTEAELKARLEFLGVRNRLNWGTFWAIATGEDYPRSVRHLEYVKAMVDDGEPEKYSIYHWFNAFAYFVRFNPRVTEPISWD